LNSKGDAGVSHTQRNYIWQFIDSRRGVWRRGRWGWRERSAVRSGLGGGRTFVQDDQAARSF